MKKMTRLMALVLSMLVLLQSAALADSAGAISADAVTEELYQGWVETATTYAASATTGTLQYGSGYFAETLTIYFRDTNGNNLTATADSMTYSMDGDSVDISTLVAYYEVEGYVFDHAAPDSSTSQTTVTSVQIYGDSSSWFSSYEWRYNNSSNEITELYLIYTASGSSGGDDTGDTGDENATFSETVVRGSSVDVTFANAANYDWRVVNSAGEVVDDVEVTVNSDGTITLDTEITSAIGTYQIQYGTTDSSGFTAAGSGSLSVTRRTATTTSTTLSGNMNHIEIEIDGTASFVVNGKTYTEEVTITTADVFTVKAFTVDDNGNKTYVAPTNKSSDLTLETVDGASGTTVNGKIATYKGDGSSNGSTVTIEYHTNNSRQSVFPTGTYANPVYYEISTVRTITFTLDDGTEMTVDVTLVAVSEYWASTNHCPGVVSGDNKTEWAKGKYVGNGMDIPISGTAIGQMITEGKLGISKKLTSDAETGYITGEEFKFTVQVDPAHTTENAGKYLVFDDKLNFTGYSDTPDYITVASGSSVVMNEVPIGFYIVTEVQQDGYVITDAEGNETDNYTKDYIVEEKTDDEIPLAEFTNKKLTTTAAVSIAKVSSGVTNGSYEDPTIAIYECDANGNITNQTAVWSGKVTANASAIYPNVALTAGQNYLVVETGYDVAGYTCTSQSMTVDGTAANSWMFTAAKAERHDIVVSNVYNNLTTVAVTKTVDGNMGDRSKEFTVAFSVTHNSTAYTAFTVDGVAYDATKTYTIKHGQTIVLGNIPLGATVTVTETDTTYTESYKVNGATAATEGLVASVTAAADGAAKIEFINTKSETVDTGILLDSLPYVLILVLVGGGVVLWMANRRRRRED